LVSDKLYITSNLSNKADTLTMKELEKLLVVIQGE